MVNKRFSILRTHKSYPRVFAPLRTALSMNRMKNAANWLKSVSKVGKLVTALPVDLLHEYQIISSMRRCMLYKMIYLLSSINSLTNTNLSVIIHDKNATFTFTMWILKSQDFKKIGDIFALFLKKTTPYGKSVKSCVIYLTKKNKISPGPLGLASARIASKIWRGQPPTI